MLLAKTPTARLHGRVRYTFLDGNGRKTFARDQRGHPIWGGHWNHNLITNVGLDNFGTTRIIAVGGSGGTLAQQWRARLHIGTGSTAPAVTDTSLVSQVAVGSADGGFAAANTFPDPAGGFAEAHYSITRVLTMGSAQNLTEYGFSESDIGGLNIRELFRDEADAPITISLAAGKKIRLDHTLIVRIPWGATEGTLSIEEYDASDTLVTTHALTVDGLAVGANSAQRGRTFLSLLPDNAGVSTELPRATLHAAETPSSDPTVTVTVAGDYAVASDAYVPGSYERRAYFELAEAEANGLMYGYTIGLSGGLGSHGFRVALKSPSTFTKADTHTLRLAIDKGWARG